MSGSARTYPWGTERRFNAYVNFMRDRFGGRVQKLTLDGGFTCPNRDGTQGRGGCTFCDNAAFNPSYCRRHDSITHQLDEGIAFHRQRYSKAVAYVAYFQAYSNTYASVAELEEKYSEALSHAYVKGLVLGTRPDCLPAEVIDLLGRLAEKHFIHVEIGAESFNDRTLLRINRGHDSQATIDAIGRCASAGLKPGIHLIFGLPGEDEEDMLEQATVVSELPILSLKMHQLQIVKGTQIEKEFSEKPEDFVQFSLDAYIDHVISFTERLNPAIHIERFAGEVPPRYQATEAWGRIRYETIIQRIEKRMEEKDTWQGRRWSGLQ